MGVPTVFCLLGILSCCVFLGVDADCPDGWLSNQDYCYGYHENGLSWEEAEDDCKTYGRAGHLTSITTMPTTLLLSRFILASRNAKSNIWIGLRDINETGKWRWIDNSLLDYNAWMEGHPDSTGKLGHCAELTSASGLIGWIDADCKTSKPYVCKY